MPPCSIDAFRLEVILLLCGFLVRGVERVLKPNVCLDFPLCGFLGDKPSDVERLSDLDLFHPRLSALDIARSITIQTCSGLSQRISPERSKT